jgi:TonB family protein
MKKITLILLLAIAKIGFAQNTDRNNAQQDTTLVYNSPMYTKDPVRSKWRPVIKRAGEFYQVSFYDRKDVLKEVISFEDKELTVRKGPYLYYTGTSIADTGAYDKGHKHGQWISYGLLNGERYLRKTEHYYYGKLDGKFVENWPNQQVQQEGSYENGRKIGEWRLIYKDGKLAGKEVYDAYGKKSSSEYFFNDGKPATYEDLFSKPSFDGGMQAFYRFLSSHIRYPKQSAKDGITGTVQLRFTVNKDGSIEDVEVIKSPNNELGDEALRVIERSPNWIPGKNFGEPVNVKYNIPIKFSL